MPHNCLHPHLNVTDFGQRQLNITAEQHRYSRDYVPTYQSVSSDWGTLLQGGEGRLRPGTARYADPHPSTVGLPVLNEQEAAIAPSGDVLLKLFNGQCGSPLRVPSVVRSLSDSKSRPTASCAFDSSYEHRFIVSVDQPGQLLRKRHRFHL